MSETKSPIPNSFCPLNRMSPSGFSGLKETSTSKARYASGKVSREMYETGACAKWGTRPETIKMVVISTSVIELLALQMYVPACLGSAASMIREAPCFQFDQHFMNNF